MLILSLETSSENGCIMIADRDIPLKSQFLAGGPNLSRTLALEVKTLIGELKPAIIAVGTGPGSYTGIRVGAALAKGLAFGWNIPLMGFCSLKAFGSSPILVDARGGGFYALLDQVPLLLSPEDPKLQSLTEIYSPHPELIKKRLGSKAVFHQAAIDSPYLAKLIWRQFLERGIEPFELNYKPFSEL